MSQATQYPYLAAFAKQAREARTTYRVEPFPEESSRSLREGEKITFDGSDIITFLRNADRVLNGAALEAALPAIHFDRHVQEVVNAQKSGIADQPERVAFLDNVLADLTSLEQRLSEAAGVGV